MFQKASRLKLRFPLNGNCTTEDLWDFSKETLAELEVNLQTNLEKQTKTNRFAKKNNKIAIEEIKLAIVSYIIDTKVIEEEESVNASAKKAKRDEILSLIVEKQKEEMKGKSIEDLQKELESL